MTRKEALEICLDVFTEYLPKKVLSKDEKKEVAEALLQELEDQGALELETDESAPDEEVADELI
jgi:hypothetical protein